MKLSIPLLVLAAGLSAAATTFAQNAPAGAQTVSRSNTVLSDGTHEVRVESDGVTASVTLDGNQVAKLNMADAWTVHKVTDPSGAVIATIWRAGIDTTSISASFGDIDPGSSGTTAPAPWMAKLERLMADEQVREGMNEARGEIQRALARAGQEMPKVMIGITMDETPDELLAGLGYEASKTSSISSVVDNGPAAKAGLQAGDVIVAFDDATSADAMAIRDALKNNNPGDAVSVSYIRDGAVQTATLTLEAYSPQAFGLGVLGQLGESRGGGFRHFLLSDEEMSRMQKQIAELSAQLEQISSELASAIGARAEELGKLSAELGMQIADLASELARRSAAALSSSFWSDAGGQNQIIARVVPDGSGGAQEVILMPTPAAPAPPGAASPTVPPSPSTADALRSMDERIRRMEELLEKIAAQQAQPPASGNR